MLYSGSIAALSTAGVRLWLGEEEEALLRGDDDTHLLVRLA